MSFALVSNFCWPGKQRELVLAISLRQREKKTAFLGSGYKWNAGTNLKPQDVE